MPDPTATLHALRASTADLLGDLEARHWADADAAAASLCPGWTRGHVLTHLARNADGIAATLAGALRGQIVARYPDGWDARNTAIDDGAGRPLAILLTDLRDSAERLDRVVGAVHEADGWTLPTEHDRPAAGWLLARWREIEIHHVDLDAGFGPERWPPLLVSTLLPDVAATLPDRVQAPVRVTVTAAGSLAPEHVDARWTAGEGSDDAALDVRGPDWAVLAWLVGRPAAAAAALTATPPLRDWS